MAALTPQRLAQAAFLYYVKDMSQAEVARLLGVSRSNVSRMLSAAREQKLVRFEIDYPTARNHSLESDLLSTFGPSGLREAIVVETNSLDGPEGGVGALLSVCRGASEWLSQVFRPGQTVGLSWGSTIQTMVDSARFEGHWNIHVVQLTGVATFDPKRSGHDLVRDLAERVGGTYTYFHAPAVAPTKEVARSLEGSPLVAAALSQAKAVDLAILGVGAFNIGSSATFFKEIAEATPEDLEQAETQGVVGQMCGRFFDSRGRQVDLPVSERVLSIELDDLRKIPVVTVVAAGDTKAPALHGAMVGGLVNVAVVDSTLARAVLSLPVRALEEPRKAVPMKI